MRALFAILCLMTSVTTFAVEPDVNKPLPAAATMPIEPALVRQSDGDGATFDANVVTLLHGVDATREVNALVLPATRPTTLPSQFQVRAAVRLEAGGEGLGIVLFDASRANATPDELVAGIEDWEEPSVAGAIGIGLDGRDPAIASGSDASAVSGGEGNIYDRPQREASVHVDGREVLNRQSPDFATNAPVPIVIELRFVPGGALLDLNIAGQPVYHNELLAGVRPFVPRIAIGARSGSTRARVDVRELAVALGPPLALPIGEPRHVVLFDRARVSVATSREPTTQATFDDAARRAARVIATFKIAAPAEGFDRLDRRGALYCHAVDGQRYELFRFRTPLAREWQWSIDVTDFLPLFRDENRFGLFCDTWRDGFLMSVALDFYPGPSERRPVAVVNLWQGEPILGDPQRPIETFFEPRSVQVPPGATSARVRLTVTGHGRSPNDRNAAEGLALRRELRVNGHPFDGLLWKNDNYLNPCRPQRGPWAADRAGWGPGSITVPWTVDVPDAWLGIGTDRTLTLAYRLLDGYVNTHVGKGDPPTQWVDGQVIFYVAGKTG